MGFEKPRKNKFEKELEKKQREDAAFHAEYDKYHKQRVSPIFEDFLRKKQAGEIDLNKDKADEDQ